MDNNVSTVLYILPQPTTHNPHPHHNKDRGQIEDINHNHTTLPALHSLITNYIYNLPTTWKYSTKSIMSEQGDLKELVAKFSPLINVESLETIFTSPFDTLFSELTPLLFDPTHHHAAHHLLITFLKSNSNHETQTKTQTRSMKVASYILSYTQKLQPSDTFVTSDAILQLFVSQLHSPVVSLATQSSQALETLCAIRPPVIERLLKSQQHGHGHGHEHEHGILHPIPVEDSTIMIRYYTLIAKIIPPSDLSRHFDNYNSDGIDTGMHLFQPFLNGLRDDNDPLLQLSLLEVLEQAGEELIRNDAWDGTDLDIILQSMTGNSNGSGASTSLHPFDAGAALRILALRESSPEKFYGMVQNFSREMSGEVEKIGFVDGLTTFCRTDEGLAILLSKQSDNENELLSEWLSFRRGGQSKLKAVVMNSVAQVLKRDTLSHDLRLNLFKAIGIVNDVGGGRDSVEMIMKYVKSQIVELRFGAYELLTAVAGVETGANLLMRYGGFFEFCCNRNLEVVKEGKELKFGLVEAVHGSDIKGLLSDEVVKVLEQVIADGPYYVKGIQYDVALA